MSFPHFLILSFYAIRVKGQFVLGTPLGILLGGGVDCLRSISSLPAGGA
jgi:hypothetical protein